MPLQATKPGHGGLGTLLVGGSQVYCTGSQAGHCKRGIPESLALEGQSRLTRSDSDRLNNKMSIQRSMTKVPRKKCSGFGHSSCCSFYSLATVTNYKVESRTVTSCKVNCHKL